MKSLLFFIMIFISTMSYSQILQRQKPVSCLPLPNLIDSLENTYGQKLDFVGINQIYSDIVTNIAMYRNKETGSWTILEFSNDPAFEGEGCILGSGKETNS